MRNDDLLRQAHLDAERIRSLPQTDRDHLNRETDWNGRRMSGYEPRPNDGSPNRRS